MAHLVADAVCSPAQRQFAQVTRPQYERVVVVRKPEEVARPLARLDIFKGDVVIGVLLGERVSNVAKHLHRRRADVDLVSADAERLHQAVRVAACTLARGESGHGVRKNVGAGQLQPVHRVGSDNQRLSRVEAAREADHDLFDASGSQPLHQPVHLDIVGLVCLFVAPHCIARHEGKALDLAPQTVDALRQADAIFPSRLPRR